MRNRRHLPVADGFVASGRLGKRVHSELALQDRDARAVLAHRAGTISCRGEELHPPDMRRLVERIEVDPPAGRRDRPSQVAVFLECRDEPIQHAADGPLHRGSPRGAPVVELGAVAEREPRHERAARQLGRGSEVRRVSRGAERLEPPDVDVVVRRDERDLLSVDAEDVRPDGTAEHRQRPAEGAPRRGVVRVRPQERRKLLAAVWPSIRGQDGQDRNRLAGVNLERLAPDRDLGRAEEPDLRQLVGARGVPSSATVSDAAPTP